MRLRRSLLLAVCIILFIYFEIHSCAKDRIEAPSPEPSPSSIICAATNVFFLDGRLGCVIGNLGTVMVTRDGGSTWAGVEAGDGTLTSAQLFDGGSGWLVGKDGGFYRTDDGGSTWTAGGSSGCPDGEDFYKVQFTSPAAGYVLGYHGVYKTVDGGASWCNNWLPDVEARDAWDMSFVDGQVGYLLGSRYTDPNPAIIYRTTDGAESWSPVDGAKLGVLGATVTIDFVSEAVGWAGGGAVLKTLDGGATWRTQVANATVRQFFFFDESRGFAVGGKTILKTSDGGATWMNVTPSDSRIADLRGVFFTDANDGWVVGRAPDETKGGKLYKHTLLLRTTDGGATWKVRDFPYDYTSAKDACITVD
jgi:photosystem II stability/assembly factor-like uncharacterized protein